MHLQYQVTCFFLRYHTWWFIMKTKYYAIRIEFQETVSPCIYSFIWVFNAPNIRNEDAYTELFKKAINAQTIWMIQSFTNLLRPTKFKITEELAENTTIMNFDYPMVDIFKRRQLFRSHLILNVAMMKSKWF